MRRILVLISIALVSSCNCVVPVSVSGSLEEGVTFELRETRKVQLAQVSTRARSGEWKTIWKIYGKDRIKAVRYGEATGGLKITAGPEGLVKGEVYHFQLETTNWDQLLGGSCIGSVRFAVTSQGIVEECTTDDCKERLL
jgi:hypothetical protein